MVFDTQNNSLQPLRRNQERGGKSTQKLKVEQDPEAKEENKSKYSVKNIQKDYSRKEFKENIKKFQILQNIK